MRDWGGGLIRTGKLKNSCTVYSKILNGRVNMGNVEACGT